MERTYSQIIKSMDEQLEKLFDITYEDNLPRVIIFEGFDNSGKTTALNRYKFWLDRSPVFLPTKFRPEYGWVKNNIPRHLWWSSGIVALETYVGLIEEVSNTILLIDRGMPTSVAYNSLLDLDDIPNEVLEYWGGLMRKVNGVVVHCNPTAETLEVFRKHRELIGKSSHDEVEDAEEKHRKNVNSSIASVCDKYNVNKIELVYY